MAYTSYLRTIFRGIPFVCKNASFMSIKSLPKFSLDSLLAALRGDHMFIVRAKPEVQRELLFYQNYKREIETMVPFSKIKGLLECILATETIEGNIIELGTYKGGTAIIMAHFLKTIDSKKYIYACDTFKGHPYDDEIGPIRAYYKKGDFSDASVSYVRDKFCRFRVLDKIRIIKGMFEDTLYKELEEERFSFAFIDCDLYQSAKYALNFLIPRMTDGAIIVIDEYMAPGISRAVHEKCRQEKFKVNLHPIPHITINQSRVQLCL